MNEFEVIIELGAEGGSLALHGIRTEQGWLFSRHLVDWTPELINEGRIQGKSTCVDSWDAALCLLDQYPWYKLSPIVIHPDFKDRIWVAVQQRLHDDGEISKSKLKRWYEFCHHSFASDGSGT